MLSLVCGSVLSNQRSNHVSSKDDEQTFVVINYYFFVESCALIWACTCHTAAQRVLLALVVRFLEVFVSAASAGDAATYQTPAAACSTSLQHQPAAPVGTCAPHTVDVVLHVRSASVSLPVCGV